MLPMSIRVAIVGPTSYTALYLMLWLARHPSAKITYLASHRNEQPDVFAEFPQLVGRLPNDLVSQPIDPAAMSEQADVAFLCVPHVAAMQYAPQLLDAGLKVIDLSADYRLTDAELYKRVYEHEHTDPTNLQRAVYGLPEFYADKIKDATLLANPGCYPTAAILGIAPLLARSLVKPTGIIINAASGITGAGRAAKAHLHFPEMNESFLAYNIGLHRHQPEIEQLLTRIKGEPVSALFVPHLLPLDRGILETIYLDPMDEDVTAEDLQEAMEDAYEDQPFVRLRESSPNVKHVRDTNFCDIAVKLCKPSGAAGGTDGPGKVVVISAIDNMVKGASGQAIQNMNLMFGQDETAGLL